MAREIKWTEDTEDRFLTGTLPTMVGNKIVAEIVPNNEGYKGKVFFDIFTAKEELFKTIDEAKKWCSLTIGGKTQ